MADTIPLQLIPRSVRVFQGPQGQRVEELVACNAIGEPFPRDSSLSEPHVLYVAIISVAANVPTPLGDMQIPSEQKVLMESATLQEAFEQYDLYIQSFARKMKENETAMIERLKKEMSKDGLYVPSAEESQSINRLKLVMD